MRGKVVWTHTKKTMVRLSILGAWIPWISTWYTYNVDNVICFERNEVKSMLILKSSHRSTFANVDRENENRYYASACRVHATKWICMRMRFSLPHHFRCSTLIRLFYIILSFVHSIVPAQLWNCRFRQKFKLNNMS